MFGDDFQVYSPFGVRALEAPKSFLAAVTDAQPASPVELGIAIETGKPEADSPFEEAVSDAYTVFHGPKQEGNKAQGRLVRAVDDLSGGRPGPFGCHASRQQRFDPTPLQVTSVAYCLLDSSYEHFVALNMAMSTRFKYRKQGFSGRADDIKTESNSPFGVRALKSFLHYAQTGELEHRHETGKEADSPFEEAVSDAIRRLGYDIEPQVGSAGFYIDIAVRDPEKPGRYILAVECDGASYHSSATARDRDRLRQSVLEGLGWRFHRIWSTDWFRDPHGESVRLKDSIDRALRFYGTEETHAEQPRAAAQPKRIERDEPTEKTLRADAYVLATGDLGIAEFAEIHELPLGNVAQAMRKVIDIEGSVHLTEAARRLAESAGFARVGSRMLGHIKRAAEYGQRNGFLHLEGDFLFADSNKPVRVRDRSDMPPTVKKIELVPDEEIRAALISAIRAAFSMSEEEAISEALSLMGFRRVTAKANRKVGSALKKLVQDGAVTVEEDKVSVA